MTQELSPDPTPSVGRLHRLRGVRIELRNVYADCRAGRIEAAEGTKLAYILSAIAKVLEAELIERRLDAIERHLERNGRPLEHKQVIGHA